MRKSLLFLFLFYCISASAQYFQQETNYTIKVKLNDEKHTLSAFEEIEYINHSPDALTFIYMHLWPNAYKNGNTALAQQLLENRNVALYNANQENLGYIDSLNFKVNGKSVKWEYDSTHIDICKLFLNKPLPPGGTIKISTPFHVKLPSGRISRLGHIDQSYQITQWYPKPAVYDQQGWHPMPYLNQGEFYSEFGSFDVSITVPKNYVVGATGDLQNKKELEWLDKLAKKTSERSTFINDLTFPESSEKTKTLRYIQNNVHDFAWFADKRYHVLKGEVELPGSGRKVTTWAMFTNQSAELWKSSLEYLNDATYYYSLWNGDYPYDQVTAVDGTISAGGGMEYPNITVIGTVQDAFSLETVIMHEVGHNWFYGILGSNEREHPWMDEGLNSFNENRYIETKYPKSYITGLDSNALLKAFDLLHLDHKSQYETIYLLNARRNLDQPIEFPAAEYTQINYGGIVYSKTAIVFDYLLAYLGQQTFDEAMQLYFETWKFKHPQPQDLRKIFEDVSKKDLSWFFDDMINTSKKLDYSIQGMKNGSDVLKVKIKNTGQIKAPFSISSIKNDSIVVTKWYEGVTGKQEVSFPAGDYDLLRIDAKKDIPETHRKNNTLKATGILKKTEPLRLQFLGSLENPNKTQLYYTPIIGWNQIDNFMPGVAMYNHLVPERKIEYTLAPMYSVTREELTGLAEVRYNIYSSGIFRKISVGGNYSRFHYSAGRLTTYDFNRVVPQINFHFKKNRQRSPVSQTLSFKTYLIYLREGSSNPAEPNYLFNNAFQIDEQIYNTLSYSLSNTRLINPFDVSATAQHHMDFFKVQASAQYEISFNGRKGIHLRVFAGKFLYNNSSSPIYNFRMDGQSARHDYTFDQIFLDRSANDEILRQQFLSNHGGFKVPTANGQSADWLTALNTTIDLPIPLPISIFADAGYSDSETFLYDAGIKVSVINNVFEIFFPIIYAQEIEDELDARGTTYGETIRFTLTLNRLNPFNLARDFNL